MIKHKGISVKDTGLSCLIEYLNQRNSSPNALLDTENNSHEKLKIWAEILDIYGVNFNQLITYELLNMAKKYDKYDQYLEVTLKWHNKIKPIKNKTEFIIELPLLQKEMEKTYYILKFNSKNKNYKKDKNVNYNLPINSILDIFNY